MYKTILSLSIFVMMSSSIIGQKYFSKTGEISFYSHTAMEDIEAVSNSASTVFDLESGKIQWAVLIKSFEFEKALMQEHFNENYMESSKFPKANFKGSIVDVSKLDLTIDGTYEVMTKGTLTIHGVAQEVSVPAVFTVEGGVIVGESNFKVQPADYEIDIPSVVSENIAKVLEIKIKAYYAKLDKK